jgi:hypothetical protein
MFIVEGRRGAAKEGGINDGNQSGQIRTAGS